MNLWRDAAQHSNKNRADSRAFPYHDPFEGAHFGERKFIEGTENEENNPTWMDVPKLF